MDVTSIFIQIHHKTRVLNEFVERMKISTETILLLLIYINLREMLNSFSWLDKAFIDFA